MAKTLSCPRDPAAEALDLSVELEKNSTPSRRARNQPQSLYAFCLLRWIMLYIGFSRADRRDTRISRQQRIMP